MVQLYRTELGHGLKVGFEVVWSQAVESRVTLLRVVIGEIVTDFQACFAQVAEVAAVEQFDFEPTMKGFDVGVVVGPFSESDTANQRWRCNASSRLTGC